MSRSRVRPRLGCRTARTSPAHTKPIQPDESASAKDGTGNSPHLQDRMSIDQTEPKTPAGASVHPQVFSPNGFPQARTTKFENLAWKNEILPWRSLPPQHVVYSESNRAVSPLAMPRRCGRYQRRQVGPHGDGPAGRTILHGSGRWSLARSDTFTSAHAAAAPPMAARQSDVRCIERFKVCRNLHAQCNTVRGPVPRESWANAMRFRIESFDSIKVGDHATPNEKLDPAGHILSIN